MRNQIVIYKDYGCADTTILEQELRAYFIPKKCKIDLVDATSIIKDNALNQNVLAFFMPGGASTPYRHKLETLGNDKIRRYIQNGGIYYGICAGAYYACRQTEFEKDIPESSIVEEYKLDLIDAKAIGTLYKELGIEPFSKNPRKSQKSEVNAMVIPFQLRIITTIALLRISSGTFHLLKCCISRVFARRNAKNRANEN